MCFGLQCPQLSELVWVPLRERSVAFYRFHGHRVCLVDLSCSLYSWWEGFGSSSSATPPLGFTCDFMSTSACGSSTGVCSEAALEALGLPLWSQVWRWCSCLGCCGSGSSMYSGELAAREAGNMVLLKGNATRIGQYAPVFLPGETPLTEQPGRPQSTGPQGVGRGWSELAYVNTRLFFLPVAARPQWELSVTVAQLLGLQGPWWRLLFRDTNCLRGRSYDPFRVFLQASCSWWSEGLFGQSFSVALPV